MITAESIACTSTIEPPSYVAFIREWATTLSCDLPDKTALDAFLELLAPLGTGLAAIVAVVSLILLVRDSGRRTRPYVEAKLEVGFWGQGAVDLIISNSGVTPARITKVECAQLGDKTTEVAGNLKKFFSKGYSLMPGERIRLIWDFRPEEHSVFEGGVKIDPEKDVPPEATLVIHYAAQKSNGQATKLLQRYRSTFNLDTSFKAVVPMLTGLPDVKKGEDVSGVHRDMRRGFELLATQIGELRR